MFWSIKECTLLSHVYFGDWVTEIDHFSLLKTNNSAQLRTCITVWNLSYLATFNVLHQIQKFKKKLHQVRRIPFNRLLCFVKKMKPTTLLHNRIIKCKKFFKLDIWSISHWTRYILTLTFNACNFIWNI